MYRATLQSLAAFWHCSLHNGLLYHMCELFRHPQHQQTAIKRMAKRKVHGLPVSPRAWNRRVGFSSGPGSSSAAYRRSWRPACPSRRPRQPRISLRTSAPFRRCQQKRAVIRTRWHPEAPPSRLHPRSFCHVTRELLFLGPAKRCMSAEASVLLKISPRRSPQPMTARHFHVYFPS